VFSRDSLRFAENSLRGHHQRRGRYSGGFRQRVVYVRRLCHGGPDSVTGGKQAFITGQEPPDFNEQALVIMFCSKRDTELLKSFHGRLPQNVIEPAEKTLPPPGKVK